MTKIIARLSAAGAVVAASAAPLYAQTWSWSWTWWGGWSGGSHGGGVRPVAVPEIDASAGILAVAAVLATLAFVWERRRRSA